MEMSSVADYDPLNDDRGSLARGYEPTSKAMHAASKQSLLFDADELKRWATGLDIPAPTLSLSDSCQYSLRNPVDIQSSIVLRRVKTDETDYLHR